MLKKELEAKWETLAKGWLTPEIQGKQTFNGAVQKSLHDPAGHS